MKIFFFLLLLVTFSCQKSRVGSPSASSLSSPVEEELPTVDYESFYYLILQDKESLAEEALESLKDESFSLSLKALSQKRLSETILNSLDSLPSLSPTGKNSFTASSHKKLYQSSLANLIQETRTEFSDKKTAETFLKLLEEESSPPLVGTIVSHKGKFHLITRESPKTFEISPLQEVEFLIEKNPMDSSTLEKIQKKSQFRDTLVFTKTKNTEALKNLPDSHVYLLESFEPSHESLFLVRSHKSVPTPKIVPLKEGDSLKKQSLSEENSELLAQYLGDYTSHKKETLIKINKIRKSLKLNIKKIKSKKSLLYLEKLNSYYDLLKDLLNFEESLDEVKSHIEEQDFFSAIETFRGDLEEASLYYVLKEIMITDSEIAIQTSKDEEDRKTFLAIKKENALVLKYLTFLIEELEKLQKIYPESDWLEETSYEIKSFLEELEAFSSQNSVKAND